MTLQKKQVLWTKGDVSSVGLRVIQDGKRARTGALTPHAVMQANEDRFH